MAFAFAAMASFPAVAGAGGGNDSTPQAAAGESVGVADTSSSGILWFYVRASVAGPGGFVAPHYKEYWIFEFANVYIYPDPGYRIASICDNGRFVEISNPYRIHMFRNHNVVVTFARDEFTVTASAPGGGGTVSPASQKVYSGHTAAIDIKPDPGYRTQSITDNGAPKPVTDPYYINNVDGDHNVVVTFTPDTFTVDASVSGGNGTVAPPTQTVALGGTASITITPDGSYQTATITDNGVSMPISSPYVINNVAEDHDVVVTFRQSDWMVAASVIGGNGTVSPATQFIVDGNPATVTITPDADYHTEDILDNNVSMPIVNPFSYTIPSVTENHSVVVLFAADTYTVDASVEGGYGTVGPPTQTVAYEGTAAVNIYPQTGYHIADISDNGESQTISNPYVINNVAEDHNVVVTFAPDEFAVDAYAYGSGSVSPPSQTVMYDHTAAIDIYPAAGDVISGIYDNGVPRPIADPYYIENVTSNHEVLVTFTHGEQPVWYLAEGSTAWGFSTYITIENPGTENLNATLTYMKTDTTEQEQTVGLPPLSQATVNPAALLGEADFSTRVTCLEGKTIAVDRTMYWTGPGAPSPEGHNSVGVTAPENTWYLPEGSSDWGFESWVLVQNPGDNDALVTLTYMIQGADPVAVERTVPAHSRMNFSMVDDIGVADASVMVTSAVPVIAERSMYRNNRREGHCSIGAAAPANTFYLAEGTTAWGFTTFLLLQNPGNDAADVTITYMTPEGPKAQPPFTLPPRSRWTIRLNDVPDIANTDVSTMVQANAPIVAERAMYWGGGTPLGEACQASIGLDSPHAVFYMPDGQTSEGRETYTLVQNPNDTAVRVVVSYLEANGAGQSSFVMDIPAGSRVTFTMADTLPSVRAAVKVTCLTAGKGILVERSMYWNNRGAGIESIGAYSD
jgi:hypothetical protein